MQTSKTGTAAFMPEIERRAPGGAASPPAIEDVPDVAREMAKPFDRRGSGRTTAGLPDDQWALENLRRCDEGYTLLDLANALRVLERHPDYTGRFHYDLAMHKVIDRGVTMVGWQKDAFAGEIQERFLAGIDVDLVHRAIDIVANKSALGKKF